MNLLQFQIFRRNTSTKTLSSHPLNESLCVLRTFLALIALWFASPTLHAHDMKLFADHRTNYQLAMNHLANGKAAAFKETLTLLQDYPLYPYLEYEAINIKIKQLPRKEIDAFIAKYPNSPISRKIKRKLLNQLIKKHRWQEYVDDWEPTIKDTRLNCWYLRALYRTGQKTQALSAVQPLWLKASSQPKACDPLFKEWVTGGYLSQDVAWQRLVLAMDARRTKLARYIVRKFLKDDYALLGAEYIKAHRRPQTLANFSIRPEFDVHTKKVRGIILHGIKRLARKDSDKANSLWQDYRLRHSFVESDIIDVEYALALGVATRSKDHVGALQLDEFADAPTAAIEKRIRVALSEIDWPTVFYLIQSLPDEDQNNKRWQYWLARSIEAQNLSVKGLPSPQERYLELSKTRSYYGFLAADLLSADYAMQDQPATITEISRQQLGQNIGLVRALELFALNRRDDARQEWYFGTKSLDSTLILAAGKMAEDFGWYEKAIRSYIKAQYWNDVKTRFPLAYKAKILNASKAQKLDTSWVFAIARQESAFSPDAKSHAGALGLMQLMPGTASQTAQQIGLKFKLADLIKPETNIRLGSNYLKSLLDKFNGNRILATTAYNAGPYRVKRWLKKTKSNLPFDVWIETIPFKETRSYVQNVLAFSVIYDYRMSKESQMVTTLESEQML
jgi:soluble lytic murein transglycosylase